MKKTAAWAWFALFSVGQSLTQMPRMSELFSFFSKSIREIRHFAQFALKICAAYEFVWQSKNRPTVLRYTLFERGLDGKIQQALEIARRPGLKQPSRFAALSLMAPVFTISRLRADAI